MAAVRRRSGESSNRSHLGVVSAEGETAAVGAPGTAPEQTSRSSLAAALAKARETKELQPSAAAADAEVAGIMSEALEPMRLELADADQHCERPIGARSRAREQLALAREQAEECFALRDWDMCEEALSSMLQLTPRADAIYNQRARVRLLQGRAAESADDARCAIRLCPSSPRGHQRLGRALCEQSRLLEAGDHFIEARFLGDEMSEDVET